MKTKSFIFFFLISIILISNVSALGITPGRTTFEFEPGKQETVHFNVINSEHKDINLVVLIQGELNQSIAVSEVSFEMSASEEQKELSYTFTMPSDLSPGTHSSEIVVMQLPGKSSTSEAFIGAALGVATQIIVLVPFPGKYAESSLNVIGPEADGKITFVMPILNRGKLDLVRVKGTIDIYGALNEKVTNLNTNEISVASRERGEIVSVWDTTEILPGTYRAVATIIYDEDVLTLEKQFNVGERLLDLQNIEVNEFSLGEIAKFEILVENKWGEAIVGAYAQMLVYNQENEVMADFKSATYDFPPLEKALMVAFWDTAGVKKGTYDSSIFLKYGQQSQQQELKLEVKNTEINVIGIGYVISNKSGGGTNNLTVILITAIVLLVLINLAWFFFLRKKVKNRIE
ncbi:hypothetical protein CXX78_00250 [Candidatus Parvarchaeota archaeon]|nr:MAG: hypothetical protein CXX78_00250 [Candidatus Parvarchaeota archaeon]